MKLSNILTSFLLISCALISFSSCEKKDETPPDDPFELVGTWTFNEVTTTAPILGNYTDSEPTGNIIFNEDGTGSANYSFDAIGVLGNGVPINRNDTFSWVKTGDSIAIVADDDETTTWTIINESNTDFQTSWTQDVVGVDAVEFNATLAKE